MILALVLGSCGDRTGPRPGADARDVVVGSSAGLDYVAALGKLARVAAFPEQCRDYACGVPESFFAGRREHFFRFDAERVLALRPQLVVVSPHQSGATRERLREFGISILVLREVSSLVDIEANLEALGAALDARGAARDAVAKFREQVAALRRGRGERAVTVFSYSEFGSGIWTAGTGTVAHLQIELAGARNHSATLGIRGHAKIEPERLLANEPDFVLCSPRSEASLRGSALLAKLECVRAGRILTLSDRLSSANTPFLVEGARLLQEGLRARAAQGSDR